MAPELLLKAVIAIAPVLLVLFVFDRLDAFDVVTLRAILQLACAGAAAAAVSFAVNWPAAAVLPIGFDAYSRYVAPFVEETLKAVPIVYLFAANRIGFKLDAAIAGFAVGAGFAVIENGWYLFTLPGANVSAWLVRGLGTAIMHGGATALFAVAAHEMTERQTMDDTAAAYRFNALLFAPGWVGAIALHSAFNHFPHQPAAVMAFTLASVPVGLFLVFVHNARAAREHLARDHAAHMKLLADIRAGHFAESAQGVALAALAHKFHGGVGAEVWVYAELKTELVLRAEEALLAVHEDEQPLLTVEDAQKLDRLAMIERRLGASALAAIAPRLGFSRNDLWELERFAARVRQLRGCGKAG